jgi:glycylpeptide N-tetradecanoyltransferase
VQFWKTQPVPQLGGSSSAPLEEGPIDELKHVKDVKQEPGALPSGFEWSLIDIRNDEQVSQLYLRRAKLMGQCKEVHQLLTENYVEDDDAMFRFKYSKEFLLW